MDRQLQRSPARLRRREGISTRGALGLLVVAAAGSFVALALLTNIFERRQEARSTFVQVVEITENTPEPEFWGRNFPIQYDQYLQTVDQQRTTFGGSEAIPREATEKDPRMSTSRSKLERIPQLRRMWAGYAFAQDYREKRGHAYMLEDQIATERQRVVQQPGTCLHCHASTVEAMRNLGGGDFESGFEALNRMTYQETLEHVSGPIACIDCHEPGTLALRVTRPAFKAAITAWKASQGVEDYDVDTMATRQEMRSYVCGQCHVEYYFGGAEKRLVFPWSKGLRAEDALAYYDEIGFSDWTHAETGAPMLKAQHPEFELWSEGVHARSGVACADCHMPYKRVGAMKVSDHQVRSPMLQINNACQTCHKVPEAELVARVEQIQSRHAGLTEVALDALVELIDDIAAAREAGATDAQLDSARQWQRRASFLVDWVDAENSTGFHAPQEGARLLGESIDASRRGQSALR
jgi:nitrite reductase (cytochrome c-552)